MLQLVDEGLNQVKIAKYFGVTKQAISKRKKELRGHTTKVVVSKKIKQVVDNKLDAIEQLKKINTEANKILDELEQNSTIKLKAMAEIRQQLALQLEIFQTLYSLQAAEEFQKAVLETIAEVSPDVRRKIINRLNEKRSIRSAIKFS